MKHSTLNLLITISAASIVSALAFTPFTRGYQYLLESGAFFSPKHLKHDLTRPGFRCDQPHPLDPSKDGLLSSEEIFSGEEAINLLVQRHQPLVRIPSVCYDDLGHFDCDERWKPFHDIPGVLEDAYPNIYKHATVETINQFGLVYTLQGSDKDLAPILLTAHQDVVPVEEETLSEWDHPPFGAYYNETDGYLWGRGASDDKSSITALMSALEALLSQEDYNPRRSVIFAFGFDEECSGYRGASEISKHLEERYGKDGIAVILDEGGLGLQEIGDTLYALPAVYEKGYLDVWFDLDIVGGHSSAPTPHTGIGIISEIVTALEANPFKPEVLKNSPVHQTSICIALNSPDAVPELAELVFWGDLDQLAEFLAQESRDVQYLVQTSQAIDVIQGGSKINSLPEYVTLGVNHRFAPQDSIGSIQNRIVTLVEDIVDTYGIQLVAFEDDEDYEEYISANGIVPRAHKNADTQSWEPIYSGKLNLTSRKKSYVTPQSPTKGAVWDMFAGTVRYTYADEARHVVAAPGAMTGNTDTRHYLNLSPNIYRWSPGSLNSFGNIHTVNEKLLMSEHVDMARFYYDFIRNYDKADLKEWDRRKDLR